MTGGQYSPTTPTGEKGTTAPYGNIDGDFDIPKLAEAAGATYTARGDCYHVPQMIKLIENGIKNKGFSIIEGVSICPTYYGRKNKERQRSADDALAGAELHRHKEGRKDDARRIRKAKSSSAKCPAQFALNTQNSMTKSFAKLEVQNNG